MARVLIGNFKGIKGDKGDRGEAGAIGQRGSRWTQGTMITGISTTATIFSGSGITDALVNDNYLNTSTGNTYRCTVAGNAATAKWVYTGCIRGVQGPAGEVGPQGLTGAAGPQGPTGAAGLQGQRGSRWNQGSGINGTSTTAAVFPSSGITDALVNDNYLNTLTGNTYRCTVAGNAATAKWVYTGCLKGAQGPAGATGPQGPKGEAGATGPQGPKGDTGPQGQFTPGQSLTGKLIAFNSNDNSGQVRNIIFSNVEPVTVEDGCVVFVYEE